MLIMSILVIPNISAQTHEFSAYLGGGLSTLRYKPSLGDRSGRMGADFGVGYTNLRSIERVTGTETIYRQQWGIHTGIGLSWYNAKANLNNVTAVTPDKRDSEGDRFDLHTKLSGYNEKQNTLYLNIPAMALFQIDRYYAMGGFKFGIPLNRKYKSKDATLTNEAWYIDLENWAKNQTFAGYGTFGPKKFDGQLDLGVMVMLALEAGATWRVSSKLTLYTGVYFDYGLNNVAKGKQKDFINYDARNARDFTTNSVVSSFTDKVHMMAFGVKARIAMVK